MTVLRRAAGFILLLGVMSCSQRGLDARFDYESRVGAEADLSQLSSWNWVPKQYLPTGDPRIDDPAFLDRLEKLIAGELNKRGIEQSSQGQPDFVVNYEVGISTSFDDAEWMNAYSQEQFNSNPTDWEEGNLLILFVSAQTGQVVWAGRGFGELDPNASKTSANENLRKIIENIFKRFDQDRGVAPPEVKTDY